jgi:hypothetical protein
MSFLNLLPNASSSFTLGFRFLARLLADFFFRFRVLIEISTFSDTSAYAFSVPTVFLPP